MSQDDFQKATEIFRKTIPLMIRNQVPTTPPNYALWYTYIEETQPELNEELDSIIREYGFCLPSHTDHLYETYISDKQESRVSDLKNNLEILVNEIYRSMGDTIADTGAFQKRIDSSLATIEQFENKSVPFDDLLTHIKDFIHHSKEIKHSTAYFAQQMENASNEIRQLKQKLERVQQDAISDSLSGLLNRGAFDQDLSTFCANSAISPLCLILIDIDRFKNLNDHFGHLFGDLVIKAIANKLQQHTREGITAYRYGGEEFALLVPNKSLRLARQFAETIRRAIEKISIKDKRTGQAVENITVSLGVAEFTDEESAIALIDKADQELYKAKRLGRNRVMPV